MPDDGDLGVQAPERLRDGLGLRAADGFRGVGDLPLEVGYVHLVGVDDTDSADSRRGQIQRRRRTEPAGADDQHARVQELLLSGAPDLFEDDVPAVSFNLLVR